MINNGKSVNKMSSTVSGRSEKSNSSRQPKNRLQNTHNQSVHMNNIAASSYGIQRNESRRSRTKEMRDSQSPASSFPEALLSQMNQYQPLSLVKMKQNNDSCAGTKEPSRNSRTTEQSSDMPLNLCTKASTRNEHNQVNNMPNSSLRTSSHPGSVHNSIGLSIPSTFTQNHSSHQRKRSRKPKSLLASNVTTNDLPIIELPASNDDKPRKRGRPPIMTPPPNMPSSSSTPSSPTQVLSSEQQKLTDVALNLNTSSNSTTTATLLQPGWPTFTPTGQVIFPSKLNGNNMCESRKRKSVESQDHSNGSAGESRGETSENSEIESDSDSVKTAEVKKGSEILSHLTKQIVNETSIRMPLLHGYVQKVISHLVEV